jgi:hypothetical protein
MSGIILVEPRLSLTASTVLFQIAGARGPFRDRKGALSKLFLQLQVALTGLLRLYVKHTAPFHMSDWKDS